MLEAHRPRSAHRQRGDAHSSAKCEPQPPRYTICRRYLVIGACLGRGLNSTSRAVWFRGSERRQSAHTGSSRSRMRASAQRRKQTCVT